MQESHAAALAALQTELADSKQETAAAKADAVVSAREAVVGADKKVQRLTERTAKVSCCQADPWAKHLDIVLVWDTAS